MKHSTIPGPGQGLSSNHIYLRPGMGVKVASLPIAPVMRPDCLDGTTRGVVKGFTRESASRLRNLLFGVDYSAAFGIALTSPPWASTSPEKAFDQVSKHKSRCPRLRSVIWRKEVTKKGVPHYHLIVFPDAPGDFPFLQAWLVKEWSTALIPASWVPPSPDAPRTAEEARNKTEWVNLRAKNLTLITSASAVQYLCDHTSKHKAYQALTTGRAWGVWWRDRLPRISVPGYDLDALPVRVVRAVQRALGKMSRYWVSDPSRPFGYRWSRERRFTGPGRRVLFRAAAPDALRRLVAYMLAFSPSLPSPPLLGS